MANVSKGDGARVEKRERSSPDSKLLYKESSTGKEREDENSICSGESFNSP